MMSNDCFRFFLQRQHIDHKYCMAPSHISAFLQLLPPISLCIHGSLECTKLFRTHPCQITRISWRCTCTRVKNVSCKKIFVARPIRATKFFNTKIYFQLEYFSSYGNCKQCCCKSATETLAHVWKCMVSKLEYISLGITICASIALVPSLTSETLMAGLTLASAVSDQVAKLQSVHGIHWVRPSSDRGCRESGNKNSESLQTPHHSTHMQPL